MNKPNYCRLFAYLTVAVLLFAAGWYAHVRYLGHESGHKLRLVFAKGFRFTNPLLDVELPEGVIISQEPIPFKHKIELFVQRQIQSGRVRDVSVYYRDLHYGPWFGINEDREFNPASMMKVPVMIAWLKRAEKDQRVFKHTMIYDGREDMSAIQGIRSAHGLTLGQSYTIEELLHYMINYSDNNAYTLLYKGMKAEELNAVLDGMDVNNSVKGGNNSITVHGYSGFFRILYNASFLSREMSEKALTLLSLQDFPHLIVAGVPAGIPVASKFGEFGQDGPAGERQLHEFGIVYHPKHPYILGIMTRGNDTEKQADVLREISLLIYREVDSDIMNTDTQ